MRKPHGIGHRPPLCRGDPVGDDKGKAVNRVMFRRVRPSEAGDGRK